MTVIDSPAPASAAPLLEVSGLSVSYPRRGLFRPPIPVVEDVSFTIGRGETVGLVGESGAGKSTIGRAILGLVPVERGRLTLDGVDLAGPGADDARAGLQAVFQDPFGSLNPSLTIGTTLREALTVRRRVPAADARERIGGMLRRVGLPADTQDRRPAGFSGGQRQRVGVARALTPEPRLVVCDEATSSLDLLTRESIIDLLVELQRETGVAYLFIAHDLPLVAEFADRVLVLYRGRVMESGPADIVGEHPLHPYTRALVESVPVLDPLAQRRRRRAAQGAPPVRVEVSEPPAVGCPFAPRCPYASQVCQTVTPRVISLGDRTLACHLFDPAVADIERPEFVPALSGAAGAPAERAERAERAEPPV